MSIMLKKSEQKFRYENMRKGESNYSYILQKDITGDNSIVQVTCIKGTLLQYKKHNITITCNKNNSNKITLMKTITTTQEHKNDQ